MSPMAVLVWHEDGSSEWMFDSDARTLFQRTSQKSPIPYLGQDGAADGRPSSQVANKANCDNDSLPPVQGSDSVDTTDSNSINRLKEAINEYEVPGNICRGSIFAHSADGADTNLLVLLHGLGDTPKNFVTFASTVSLPQTCSLSLQAPISLGKFGIDGHMWMNSFEDDGNLIDETSQSSQLQAAELLNVTGNLFILLKHICCTAGQQGSRDDANRWRPECVFLFGFSQGGTVAVEVARLCASRGVVLGGVVGVCTSMLSVTLSSLSRISTVEQHQGCPLLLINGDKDDVVPVINASRTVDAWKRTVACEQQQRPELVIVADKQHGMIASAAETTHMMEFIAPLLVLRSIALEDDPGVIQITDRQKIDNITHDNKFHQHNNKGQM